jgi:hypothetical protein
MAASRAKDFHKVNFDLSSAWLDLVVLSASGPHRTCRSRGRCPLSGVKRTCPLRCEMSAFDPKRTSVGQVDEPRPGSHLLFQDATFS